MAVVPGRIICCCHSLISWKGESDAVGAVCGRKGRAAPEDAVLGLAARDVECPRAVRAGTRADDEGRVFELRVDCAEVNALRTREPCKTPRADIGGRGGLDSGRAIDTLSECSSCII